MEEVISRMESSEKMNVPYYQIAKEALMNWNGLSEAEAVKMIESSTFEEIEGQVWAKSSINYAIEGITKSLSLTDFDVEQLTKAIYGEGANYDSDIFKELKPEMDRIGKNPNDIIMDTLFTVHDGWVKDNQKKFMAREKKHQHMPSELIGWNEVKADLLFVKPIFAAAGIEISEEALKAQYDSRVKNFLQSRDIKTTSDLSREISKGAEFYPALEGQEEVLSVLGDREKVDSMVIPQIESKGIGKVEDIIEPEMEQSNSKEDVTQSEAKKETTEDKIPVWIQKGKKFIYQEREAEWEKCVNARAGDLYRGADLDYALQIIESLERESGFEEAKQMLEEQGHSGNSMRLVRNIIFAFSKKGPEFYEYTADGNLSEKEKKVINRKKKENEKLAKKHGEQSVDENLPRKTTLVDRIKRKLAEIKNLRREISQEKQRKNKSK